MRAAVFCLCCLVLAGCGQRGGLYLPDEPRTAVPAPADPAAAQEEKKKKTETPPPGR